MHAAKLTRTALAAALALSAGTAFAQPSKCQSALEKIVNKYGATVQKSLAKCQDGVQKAYDNGDPVEGDGCDGAILKLDGTRTKTLGKCLGAKCTASDLAALGHFISGVNAPAGVGLPSAGIAAGGLDFVCSYLIKRAEHLAVQTSLAADPGAPTQWKDAADADLTPADGIGQWFFGSGATPPWVNAQPSCASHACSLGGSSGAALRADVSGGSPIPLAVGGIVQLDICRFAPNTYAIEDDTRMIAGAVTKSLTPVLLLGNNVCTRTLRAEGWCDCGAASNSSINVDVCRDSCTAGSDGCPQLVTMAAADPTSPNCANGALKADFSGASATGDCLTTLSVEFKITPGAANGADATPCTYDDLVAPTPASGLLLTTGTAIGTVIDAGASSPTETGTNYTNTSTGTPIGSCANLDASTLTGLKLVGNQPALDGTAPIGDSLISLTLQCN